MKMTFFLGQNTSCTYVYLSSLKCVFIFALSLPLFIKSPICTLCAQGLN